MILLKGAFAAWIFTSGASAPLAGDNSLQAAAPKQMTMLEIVQDACTDSAATLWDRAPRAGYVDEVMDYHEAYWDKLGTTGLIQASELINPDDFFGSDYSDKPHAVPIYKFTVMTEGVGALTIGCSVHFGMMKVPTIEAMTEWSGDTPREKLILAMNEETWGMAAPPGSGWEFASVTYFDPSIQLPKRALKVPVKGLVIGFSKTELD